MNGPIEYLFDTCAAVDFLDNPAARIWPGDLKNARRSASVITRMELLSRPDMSREDEDDRRRFLSQVRVVPLAAQIEEEAVRIRRQTRRKLPDCIIAATAVVSGATLLSGDSHLTGMDWPGLTVFNINTP
jgi:predicted nucleic acid-binding protein